MASPETREETLFILLGKALDVNFDAQSFLRRVRVTRRPALAERETRPTSGRVLQVAVRPTS